MTTTNPTMQERVARLRDTMERGGIPCLAVTFCGSFPAIWTRSRDNAGKAASCFAAAGFQNVRVRESAIEAKEQGTRKTLGPKFIKCFLVSARVS